MTEILSVPVLPALAAGDELSAAGLGGLHRVLVEAYLAYPRLYALGMVVGLLLLGTVIGLVTEAVLKAMGRGTERIVEHHE